MNYYRKFKSSDCISPSICYQQSLLTRLHGSNDKYLCSLEMCHFQNNVAWWFDESLKSEGKYIHISKWGMDMQSFRASVKIKRPEDEGSNIFPIFDKFNQAGNRAT